MKDPKKPTPAEKGKTPPEKRSTYHKPTVTKHGNLKKITGLSFQPPE